MTNEVYLDNNRGLFSTQTVREMFGERDMFFTIEVHPPGLRDGLDYIYLELRPISIKASRSDHQQLPHFSMRDESFKSSCQSLRLALEFKLC